MFIALLCERIKSGGYLHIATDWQNYAEQMLAVLSNEMSLINSNKDYAQRPASRPLTKFEQRGIKLGHRVWDLIFTKK
jgi:tRNA (guanine-N7-)-methyltransferase